MPTEKELFAKAVAPYLDAQMLEAWTHTKSNFLMLLTLGLTKGHDEMAPYVRNKFNGLLLRLLIDCARERRKRGFDP